MKRISSLIVLIATMALYSCSNGQSSGKTNLEPAAFADKIKETADAQIVDVRTPGEFAGGHIANALNYDWNSGNFESDEAKLDKSKPVFVYCLSGGRSAAAAKKLRADGFKEVYELNGGMMKWRNAGLAETTDNTVAKSTGMTMQEFEALIPQDKIVLVDFYADWCAPCKKMKPYLDEIAKDMADKVVVVRINADEHTALCKEMKIDGLPVLQVYKNKAKTWQNLGYLEKADVVKQLQ